MLPQVLDVTVPVAVEELRDHLGLVGGLLVLVLALLVGLVAFLELLLGVLGVDGGDEGDLLAVARPDRVVGLGADGGQLPGLAAIEVDDPELEVAGAVGLEQEALAVGAPAG